MTASSRQFADTSAVGYASYAGSVISEGAIFSNTARTL